ncbi:acetylcholinesterase-1-like [Tetranychus urticae]|uniref:Carboxylic ester hydrolase n=1 Tax=Tetranychus urticae TaxID=32264 RepID=T1JSJ5_TETUR|nr:acetylcholinesterase-1-like [Tetranychus urticae]
MSLVLPLIVTALFIFRGAIESGSTVKCDDPIVTTEYGTIKGNRKNESGFVFDEFLGIRYGKIPERFKFSRVNEEKWTGILNATDYGPECKQLRSPNSVEDCLFINIWRPLISNKETRLPVFLWVHGSGFQIGSGALNPGNMLASYGNMIVATINYRLGSLGYAFGDLEEMPGNQGVSDVTTALYWVNENIVHFGGDPDQVTLAGHSAGSMIASLPTLLRSERPWSLYSRLLLSSGVSYGPMFIEDTSISLAKTKLLASKVGCGSATPGPLTSQTISCLRTVNASVLLEHKATIKQIGSSDVAAFFPTCDRGTIRNFFDPFLKPYYTHDIKPQILFYLQKDETSYSSIDLQPTSKAEAYQMAWDKLSFIKKDLTQLQMQPFFEYYFNDTRDNDNRSLRSALSEFLNDHTFRCTSLMLAQLYSTNPDNSVRFAEFRYILDKYGQQNRPDGAWHDDVVELFFGEPFRGNNSNSYSNQDRKQSLRLMKSLADYAYGKEPDNWPKLHFDYLNPEKEPIVREINFKDRNVEYSKQHICLEWSKLLDYDITNYIHP